MAPTRQYGFDNHRNFSEGLAPLVTSVEQIIAISTIQQVHLDENSVFVILLDSFLVAIDSITSFAFLLSPRQVPVVKAWLARVLIRREILEKVRASISDTSR